MELDNTSQESVKYLTQQGMDIYLAVSANESRCTGLLEKVDVSNIGHKIALSFTDQKKTQIREQNDNRFKSLGFILTGVPSCEVSVLHEILDPICIQNFKDKFNILIDYSCMTQVWYNEIINYFLKLEEQCSNISLWFAYSPAAYNKPETILNKFSYQAIPEGKPDKPLALIIGLGYDKGRTEELAQKINAQAVYAFYPDPSMDDRYVNDLLKHNLGLLKKIDQSNIVPYPLYDLNSTNSLITALCVNLRLKYRIVLASVGPKTFSLLSYILSARYPDITIWNVTAGPNQANDRKPNGDLLLYKAEFTSEEVDY
ncbi:MAG: hypothetical protein Q8928_12555 [Bacteroidota bacterium]|nr:hypothetical protein [Bacteroidota bacterium]